MLKVWQVTCPDGWVQSVTSRGRRTKPKTTTIQKTICGGSVEEEALQTLMAKEDRGYERSTQEYYYVFQRSWC